jgi:hypothetical protein
VLSSGLHLVYARVVKVGSITQLVTLLGCKICSLFFSEKSKNLQAESVVATKELPVTIFGTPILHSTSTCHHRPLLSPYPLATHVYQTGAYSIVRSCRHYLHTRSQFRESSRILCAIMTASGRISTGSVWSNLLKTCFTNSCVNKNMCHPFRRQAKIGNKSALYPYTRC